MRSFSIMQGASPRKPVTVTAETWWELVCAMLDNRIDFKPSCTIVTELVDDQLPS